MDNTIKYQLVISCTLIDEQDADFATDELLWVEESTIILEFGESNLESVKNLTIFLSWFSGIRRKPNLNLCYEDEYKWKYSTMNRSKEIQLKERFEEIISNFNSQITDKAKELTIYDKDVFREFENSIFQSIENISLLKIERLI